MDQNKIDAYQKELAELWERKTQLEMKDNWSLYDNRENSAIIQRIVAIKTALKELGVGDL